VFWQDYFNWELAAEGFSSGIAALVRLHEQYAGGATNILFCDDDLYIMQRKGNEQQQGLVFVLNNRQPLEWSDGIHAMGRNEVYSQGLARKR